MERIDNSHPVRLGDVLVTGGTGFFGQHFVRRLLDDHLSDRICIYSRDEFKQFHMRERFQDDSRLRWFIGDVRDEARLSRAMRGVLVVVHAAALKRIEVGFYNPSEMVKTNVLGTMNVVEACQDNRVRTAVLLSSDKAFQPISAYGQSKALAESIFLASNGTGGVLGTRFMVTRYGNVANSTGSVIPVWRAAMAAGKPVRVTDPEATRFWMYAHEAVDLVMAAIVAPANVRPLLIPTLPAYRLGDLCDAMAPMGRVIGSLPAHEKMHESMDFYNSSDIAKRLTVDQLKEMLTHV